MAFINRFRIDHNGVDRTVFSIVESPIWHRSKAGAWNVSNERDDGILLLGPTEASGSLRFSFTDPDTGEKGFVITWGLDTKDTWCDIVADIDAGTTASVIQTEYYDNGDRIGERMLHKKEHIVKNRKGRELRVNITDTDNIVITICPI